MGERLALAMALWDSLDDEGRSDAGQDTSGTPKRPCPGTRCAASWGWDEASGPLPAGGSEGPDRNPALVGQPRAPAFAPAGAPTRWWASGPDDVPVGAGAGAPTPQPTGLVAAVYGDRRLWVAGGGHLLAPAGSSFGHVQRHLLSGEGSRHDPVPCAWQPDSADPLQSGQPDRRDPST